MRSVRTVMLVAVAGAMGVAAAACQQDRPRLGDSSGRVSATTTTPAEARSQQVLPASLMEFADQAARDLARDLSDQRIYGISDNEVLATIVFGDILNQTQIVSSADFEMARVRMRNQLMQSDLVRTKVRFVENRQRMEELRAREWGSAEGVTVKRFNPAHTFFLNGTMYRVARNGSNLYQMTFELTAFETGELVFTNEYLEKR
jgi:hypothetical protein